MKLSEQYTAFSTVLIKEVLRFVRIWVQTIVPAAVTTGLYFVIFGNLIGSQLGDIQGQSYVDYIVPGIILMSIINNSYANVVSSFYSHKFQHNIEEMLVSPMPNYLIIWGFVAGGVARGLSVGFVVTVVAMLFTDIKVDNAFIILAVVLLTAILFSLAGFINAIYANSFDDISIIPTFVLTPLTYLGGIFYSISMLPEFWQKVSLINPILYMVNSFRYGLLGISDTNMTHALLIIFTFIIVLYSFAMHLLNIGKGIKN